MMNRLLRLNGKVRLTSELKMGLKVRHARGKELTMTKERRELRQKDREHRKEMIHRYWLE